MAWQLSDAWPDAWPLHDVELFKLGTVQVSLLSLLKLGLLGGLLYLVAGRFSAWVIDRLLRHSKMGPGERTAVSSLVHYTLLIVGTALILENAGIHLTTFALVASALGVGVGFGLQNIISNFISGLIIMIERPIEVGDRIELGGVEGVVHEIGVRRATVITPDRIAILVPNQRFITDNVTNYIYLGRTIRLRVPLNVTGDSDLDAAKRMLLDVAATHPQVEGDPEPEVTVTSMGAASVGLELHVWYDGQRFTKQQVLSELYVEIGKRLSASGIKLA